MFDARLRRWIDPALAGMAARLDRIGVGANTITWGGFALGLASAGCLAVQAYGPALALLLANRLADGLDGAVARRRGATDYGGFLDILLDMIFYSGFVFGFALGQPEQALAAAFLMFSFVGSGSSFLAYASLAAKRGLTTEAQGQKSIFYLGGLAEGGETIAVFIAICLFPNAFTLIAFGFGALCWLTVAGRILVARRMLRP